MGPIASEPAAGRNAAEPAVPRSYAWLVFALTFGLLISDYMSRQVLNAVFPVLKIEWMLSDTQLGSLSGVVALMVGLLTFPLSLLADRWGRVKSLVLMAGLWSAATLACGLSASYGQMFAARFFVGVGEAAYGSVGIAVILSAFPARMRATLTGAFTSGGLFGSVLGVALGGIVATRFGWRWSFGAMAVFGIALAAMYALLVKEKKLSPDSADAEGKPHDGANRPLARSIPLSSVFSCRSVICAYAGSGFQLFIMASILAWLPSFFNRYYAMRPDKAAVSAAVFVLIGGVGMIACGILTDKLSGNQPNRKFSLAIAYCLIAAVCLALAFSMGPGVVQLTLIGAGVFFAAGTMGPAGAMVANLTPVPIHGTAFATLTLANNLLGLAPGPFVTGWLADQYGLQGALQLVPVAGLVAVLAFVLGKSNYAGDLRRVDAMHGRAAA